MGAYDIYIEDSSGKKTGFMLAKDDDGKKMWRVSEAPPLSPRYGTGAVGYEQFPVEQEMVWAQDDWSDGFGEYKYKAGSDRYFESYNCDCRYKGQIILGPLETLTGDSGSAAIGISQYRPAFAEFGDTLYQATYSSGVMYVWKWDKTNQYFTNVLTDAAQTPFGLITYGDWIVLFGQAIYHYSTDGTSWTEITGASNHLGGVAVINNQLWRAEFSTPASGVRSCTDPTAWGNWSSVTEVGDRFAQINQLLDLEGVLLIGKEDGLYSIDADGNVAGLIPDIRPIRHDSNLNWMATHHNEAYLGLMFGGVLLYSGGVITNISPTLFSPHSAFFQCGSATGPLLLDILSDINYVYVLYHVFVSGVGYAIIIFAGRKQYVNGQIQFAWHPITQNLTNAYLGDVRACISTAGETGTYANPRMFLSESSGVLGRGCYFKLARGQMNPIYDSGYTFTATGYIYTGWWDANLTDVEKAFQYLVVDADDLSSTEYITFYYETDDSGTWTVIGKADIEGKTILSLPKIQVGDETREPTGRKIRLKIELTTGDSGSTPILKSFSLHAIPAFTPKRQFTLALQCADSVTRLNNTPDDKGAKEIRQAVWNYRKEVWPVTLTDVDGIEWLVKLQYPVQEQVIEKTTNWERHILVTATEATVS